MLRQEKLSCDPLGKEDRVRVHAPPIQHTVQVPDDESGRMGWGMGHGVWGLGL